MDQELLAALTAASNAGCGTCRPFLLDKIADAPATLARLVTISCQVAASVLGELPSSVTGREGFLRPYGPEFERLVRVFEAGDGDEMFQQCARLTPTERRAAADAASDSLMGHLRVAYEGASVGDEPAAPGSRRPRPRSVTLPADGGYRVHPPVEGPPADYPQDHRWQISVDRIVVPRWDQDAAHWNQRIADDSFSSAADCIHEMGLEVLACPGCGRHEGLVVEGRWGDPLTLHCLCGTTAATPDIPELAKWGDWGRDLLRRIILTTADPAFEARRLHHQLRTYRADEEKRRASSWYLGPDDTDIELIDLIDPQRELPDALTTALRPRLPQRHGGRPFTLFLLKVSLALQVPAVRDSEDGRHLTDAVKEMLADLRRESTRYAQARRPLLEQLAEWQAAGGHETWQAAWEHTITAAQRSLRGRRVANGAVADGCVALTTGLYLIARDLDIPPAQVAVQDVRALAAPQPGEQPEDILARWQQHLIVLGHDLDDPDDPVAAMWRRLSTIHTPSDAHPLARRGPALLDGLKRTLPPLGDLIL
ncbi:hypothetical protein [Streptomyces millisiae]|uniref:Uncharacterized protein n=1 Tax=Streptomyces millisiae TaxID=3075542 RepID=A0ABU2LZM2_9ACTN|nr:hypothetical protein [Streptomyces sp. DSM 44918]MDT0323051.1 hypothetical protein [Streptomyces sp. DSM 44918]